MLHQDVAVLLDRIRPDAEILDAKIPKHIGEPVADRRGPLQCGLAGRKENASGPKEAGGCVSVTRIDGRDVLSAGLIDGILQGQVVRLGS